MQIKRIDILNLTMNMRKFYIAYPRKRTEYNEINLRYLHCLNL